MGLGGDRPRRAGTLAKDGACVAWCLGRVRGRFSACTVCGSSERVGRFAEGREACRSPLSPGLGSEIGHERRSRVCRVERADECRTNSLVERAGTRFGSVARNTRRAVSASVPGGESRSNAGDRLLSNLDAHSESPPSRPNLPHLNGPRRVRAVSSIDRIGVARIPKLAQNRKRHPRETAIYQCRQFPLQRSVGPDIGSPQGKERDGQGTRQ